MVLWSAGIVLALGLVWFVGAVVVPTLETHRVVKQFRSRCSGGKGANDEKADAAILQLGDAETVSRRLGIYLRLPRWTYDEDLRYYAVRLAVSCERPAMKLLGRELRGEDPRERFTAAEGLARIGPDAIAFAPALERALCDPEADVRIAAGYALVRIDPGNMHGISALVEVLSAGDAPAQSSAAWHLGWLGPYAKAATPALEDAARSGNESLQYAAAEALKKIRGEEPPK